MMPNPEVMCGPHLCPNCSSKTVVLAKRGAVRQRQCVVKKCSTRFKTEEAILVNTVGQAPRNGRKVVSKVQMHGRKKK